MAASQIGLRRRYSIQRDICPCIKGAENIAESGVAKSGYGAEGDGKSDRDNEEHYRDAGDGLPRKAQRRIAALSGL